jgi:hypothetical protein
MGKPDFGSHFRMEEHGKFSLGQGALCHRGSFNIPGRKHAVRHTIALSEEMRGMTSLAKTFFLRADHHEVWTALVHRLGLPAVPEWAEDMVQILENQNRIRSLEGIACAPILVSARGEEILGWMEAGVAVGMQRFPEVNAPIQWANKPLAEVLGQSRTKRWRKTRQKQRDLWTSDSAEISGQPTKVADC